MVLDYAFLTDDVPIVEITALLHSLRSVDAHEEVVAVGGMGHRVAAGRVAPGQWIRIDIAIAWTFDILGVVTSPRLYVPVHSRNALHFHWSRVIAEVVPGRGEVKRHVNYWLSIVSQLKKLVLTFRNSACHSDTWAPQNQRLGSCRDLQQWLLLRDHR